MTALKMSDSETGSAHGKAITAEVLPFRAKERGKTSVTSPLDERYYGKPIRQHVREFGALAGVVLLVIAAVMIRKGKPLQVPLILSAIAPFAYAMGLWTPSVLKPVWSAWMKFAHVLGMVSTFLILSLTWTLIVIPMSLLLRVLGKKVVVDGFRENTTTYWQERPERAHDFKLLERQF